MDVICDYEDLGSQKILLTNPMSFEVHNKGNVKHILMDHFLPAELLERNEVVISPNEIMFTLSPNEEFTEYYENSVENLKRLDAESEFEQEVQNDLQDRIKSILVQAFNEMEPEEKTIH
jgi:hypothetical protein